MARGIGLWAVAGAVLLVPLVAMQFTDEVAWDAADFAFMAVLLAATVGGYQVLTARSSADTSGRAYRWAAAIAVLAALALVWIDAAVGIVGDAPGLFFAAVPVVGIGGVAIARLRAGGMAWAMAATAAAQVAVAAAVTLAAPLVSQGSTAALWPITAMFAAAWLAAAALFARADQMTVMSAR